MPRIIGPSTFLAALLATSLAHADPAPSSPSGTMTVDVEIVDTSQKSTETVGFTMTLADDGSCGHATSSDGDVQVCRERGDLLSFEVKHGSRRIAASGHLAAATRTVIGKIVHGPDSTEVAATVR